MALTYVYLTLMAMVSGIVIFGLLGIIYMWRD